MRARRLLAAAVAVGLALTGAAALSAAAPAAPRAATTAPATCDQLLEQPVDLALSETATVFDQPRFEALGGRVCTWIDIGQEWVLAYAPVDAAQQAEAIADLEATGLVRTDAAEGIRFSVADFDLAGALDGEHLFADGHWYAVSQLNEGSDGSFIVPGTDANTDGLRDRVLQAVGANTRAAPAAQPGAQPGAAGEPLTCDELGGEDAAVEIIDPALDDQRYAAIWDDHHGFDAQRFTDAGGTVCTWMVGQAYAWVTLAYAPVDDQQAAAAISDLQAAGLTRTDTPDGVRFSGGSGQQSAPLDGQHLIADGYWSVVRGISIGSGGVFSVDTDPAHTDALRDRVLLAVPPAPSPTPAAAAPTPPPEPVEEPVLAADEPSVLSGLVPAGAAPVTAASVTATAGTVLVLAALVAIPNRLVDMTAGALADRARRRAAAGAEAPGLAERIRRLIRSIERRLHPAAGIAIGLVAAGALTALIDPRAGASLGTLRLAASSTLGYAIEGLLGLLVVAWLLRRDGASVAVRFRPVSLLIVLGAIVVSRVIGFEPGFVFGIVLALIFLRPSPKHEQRAALIELGYLAAIGIAAWLVYSAIQTNAPPTGPLGLLGVETLAGLTIGCLMALPLLLSPVGELPGRAIWRRSRLLWVAAFVVATALVVWVVMPFPAAWDAVHTPVVAWVVLLIAYTLAAAIAWIVVTKPFGRGADAVGATSAPSLDDEAKAVVAGAAPAPAPAPAPPAASAKTPPPD